MATYGARLLVVEDFQGKVLGYPATLRKGEVLEAVESSSPKLTRRMIHQSKEGYIRDGVRVRIVKYKKGDENEKG